MQQMQEMWVRSLGREDPLEEEMSTLPSIAAWETPWTEHCYREELSKRGAGPLLVSAVFHGTALHCQSSCRTPVTERMK